MAGTYDRVRRWPSTSAVGTGTPPEICAILDIEPNPDGNTITLSESGEDIRKKTKMMVTDPARKRRTDPGNPDVCPVYDWHKLFSSPETLKWSAEGCRTAGIGCIECKAKMADHLIEWITPIRDRRVEYEKHPARVLEVIDSGSAKAREVATVTMKRVREAVFGWDKKRKEVSGA